MAVITISRMFGSGGSEIAARVARALGWTLVDNAFVDGVAGRLGTTPAAVEAIEERVPTLAERIADAFAFGTPEVVSASLTTPMPPTEARLLEVTRRLIEETLSRGPAVLVGRGAQALLQTRDDALHVFCAAPFDALVTRVMAREGLTRQGAEALVREKNQQRAQYVRKHWSRQWDAAEHYHLCLDTSWFGIDAAADLVIQVAEMRFA